MRTSIITALVTLLAAVPVAADAITSEGAMGAFATGNGHWECRCLCWDRSVDEGEVAIIDGKCEDDYEGTSCEATNDDGNGIFGELTECSQTFVIDESD